MPAYMVFASMLYVLHEGLKKLKVEDRKLQEIEAKLNMERLRRQFRNATFHFKPHFRHEWHGNLILEDGMPKTFELYKRQTFLIHKMRKLMKHHPRHKAALLT